MKKLPFIFVLILLTLTISCSDSRVPMAWLARVDSLMEINPQAAYDSLLHNQKEMVQAKGQKVEMKYRLLEAKVANKLFKPMPSDSLFQKVVDYYDGHGSSNEKMEAHYLLGCIYRDQKEAPMAIQCYQEAVECADTLRQDCDYTTLFRIYGQMADVYRYQYLQKKALDCYQKYSYYASRAKNIACSIQGLEGMADSYYASGDTLQAIKLTKKCYLLYKQHGLFEDAAQVLPTLIYAYLYRGEYQQAHYYMDIYEKESGLLDKSKKNIQSGREHYYKAKGMYYLGINQVDSAECYYRKLGLYGFHYETAQGLLAVYNIRLNRDSIKKYSHLCEQEMDNILNGTQAKATVMANSLYSYTRLQKKIDEARLLHERNKYIQLFFCLGILFILACAARQSKKIRKRTSEKLLQASENYVHTYQKLERARKDLDILQGNTDLFVKKKQKEIAFLQATLQEYKDKYDKIDNLEKKKTLIDTDIFQKFKAMSKPQKGHKKPQMKDWDELYANFHQYLPILYKKMMSSKLSAQELQVCILTYLDMANSSMSVLIDTSLNTITNAKQKANKKLFEDNRASSLYDNLLKF